MESFDNNIIVQLIKDLGVQIEKRRKQLNMSQESLALVTGLSDSTIRYIEQGRLGVSIKNVATVANTIGLELKLSVKKMSDETRKSI